MTIRDYSKIQTVLFDLEGTLLSGLGPYIPTLKQAIGEVFGINTSVDLTQFNGFTDREILYRTLQQTNTLDIPARNKNIRFEDRLTLCLKRFGELYLADSSQIRLLQEVEETLYSMNIEGGPCVHTRIVTGDTELVARKKLALFDRQQDDDNDKLQLRGLNFHFLTGVFGNQSYYRENLVALAVQEIDRERMRKELGEQALQYGTDMFNHKERVDKYNSKREITSYLSAMIWNLTRGKMGSDIRGIIPPVPPQLRTLELPITDIYVVGDTSHDITAGIRARELYPGRIITVGVLTGRGSREHLEGAGADHIINDISKLRKIIPNNAVEY